MGAGGLERRVIIGTAGHIDHGKTALVRELTGVDTDRLPEEKRRGITIDLGFAPLEIEGLGTVGIVDVPGHEGFVRTMVAGASGIDLALLVVAADEGVMPQTREHLDILSLLGISRGVVTITKCDLVDDEWRELVVEEVRSLVDGTALDDADIVAVSSHTGAGLGELRSAIARAGERVRREDRRRDLFRMPVDRVFTMRGTGTVVTGTVWSGTLERDSLVRIEPGGKTARVRGLQSHGEPVEAAVPGTRTAVALAGCDVGEVPRGSTLVTDREWIATRELDANLVFTSSDFAPTPRTRMRVHLGTSDVGARLSRLHSAGGRHVSRLVLEQPLIARGGDRLVLRTASPQRTVGGGTVTDPYPSRRSTPFGGGGDDIAVGHFLLEAGVAGLSVNRLPVRTGLMPPVARSVLERTDAIVIGVTAWSATAVQQIEERVTRRLDLEMANHPLEDGVSLQTLRTAAKAPQEVMDVVLGRLLEQGRIEVLGSSARPAGWVSGLGSAEQSASDSILHEICIKGREPPSVSELTVKFGANAPALLRRLEREGQLERIAEDRYYSKDAVAEMIGLLGSLAAGRTYSPAELREVLGVSRKYLIPFLEYCDRKGLTRRGGAGREVLSSG